MGGGFCSLLKGDVMVKIKCSVLKARIEERDFTDNEKGTTRHIVNLRLTVLDDDGDPADVVFYEPVPKDWEKVYIKGAKVDIPLRSMEIPRGSSIPVCRAAN